MSFYSILYEFPMPKIIFLENMLKSFYFYIGELTVNKILIFTLYLLFILFPSYSQITVLDAEYSDNDFPFTVFSEGFNTPSFPPPGWTTQVESGINWGNGYVSAQCIGTGSALYPFFNSSPGFISRLISPIYVPTNGFRDSLIFSRAYAQRTGYIDNLQLYTSTNSGASWQLLTTYSTSDLITAPSSNNYYTPNCNDWQNKSILLPINVNRIYFRAISGNGNNLFIDDIIIKASSVTGVNNYGTEIPEKYFLYNNYPNPFNPTTKIRFDISEKSNVKVVVYNTLGEIIAVLVDEILKAGKYETSFTALNISSGIYFYNITTKNFTQTNKMILVK